MKRKLLEDLKSWKNKGEGKPLIIYGARQVGKTYLVREFGTSEYENIFEINFELDFNAIRIFDGSLKIEDLLIKLSSYNPKNVIKPKKTLIFLDEVQKCPQALVALKSFAIDGNYDVIASGSMLGVTLASVSSYPVGYVETIYMKPLSFEEFLWAMGYSKELIETYRNFYLNEEMVPESIHEALNKLFLQYVVVGGMPKAVLTFVETSNIGDVIHIQKMILEDYKKDMAKYASPGIREKVRECYESIPNQLAMESKKFRYKITKTGGNARYYNSSLTWIEESGLANKVFRLKTFDIPLKAYKDLTSFKLYYFDTGLLLAMYEENVQFDIINGDLGVFKGGIFENVIAQILISNDMPVYYYKKDTRLEIDFVTYLNKKIIPIEVKSGFNTKSISFNNVIKNENLDYGIKLSMNNVNCSNPKIKCFPLYMSMFIKNN